MTDRSRLSLVYAGMGASAASIGPLLPVLTDRLDTSASVLSLATSSLFAGLLVGVVVAVVASRWVAAGRLMLAGAAAQAAAIAGLAVAPTVAAVYVAAAVLGAGFGTNEVTASVLAGQPPDGASRLAHLTAVFAAAAIVTPAAMAISLRTANSVAVACILIAALHLTGGLAVRTDATRFDTTREATGPAQRPWWRRRDVTLTTAVLVAYVGAEATLATWSGELARSLLDLSTDAATLAPTAFWVCLLVGRIAATRLLRRIDARRLLLGTLVTGGAAALLGAATGPSMGTVAVVLVATTSVAMGPVYGVTLSFGARPTGGTPMVRTGVLVGVGALGGAVVPAVVASWTTTGSSAVVIGLIGAFLVVAAAMSTGIPRSASNVPASAATFGDP